MTKKSTIRVTQEPTLGITNLSVHDQARLAAFYSNKDGKFFRMDYCEEYHFVVSDEDTWEQFKICYADVDLSKEAFYKLVKIN